MFGNNQTKRRSDYTHFKFGIYRRGVSAKHLTTPTQIVYYDDVRKGKTCSEVTEYFPCVRDRGRSPRFLIPFMSPHAGPTASPQMWMRSMSSSEISSGTFRLDHGLDAEKPGQIA